MPRRPVERVDRDAAVDPARRVTGVEGVRQRWQQVLGDPGRLPNQLQHLAAVGFGEIVGGKPADQRFGQFAVGQAFEVAADLVDQAEPDLVRHDLVVEDPLLRLRDGHRLGQQVVHLDDLDPAVAHLLHEVEMVALGDLDPDHVVDTTIRRNCSASGADVRVPARRPSPCAAGRLRNGRRIARLVRLP